MADDVLFPLKGLHAGFAGEEPLTAVDVFFMDLQVAAVCKRLLAGLTAVDNVGLDSVVGAGQVRRTDSLLSLPKQSQVFAEDVNCPCRHAWMWFYVLCVQVKACQVLLCGPWEPQLQDCFTPNLHDLAVPLWSSSRVL